MNLDYVPGLGPDALLSEVRRLLELERRAEWLVCRYLADLAEGDRYRQVGWFSDIYHFARVRLRLGVRRTRERIRIGRALRDLPELERAFAGGEVSFGRVRPHRRMTSPAKAGYVPRHMTGCGRRRWVDVHHVEHRAEGGEHSRRNCLCLCTTCHQALHEGRLRIEGDAEGTLRFFQEDGRPLEPAPVTQCGSSPSIGERELRILRHMGNRGGWTAAGLCDELEMDAEDVMCALLTLALAGLVKNGLMTVEPTGAALR